MKVTTILIAATAFLAVTASAQQSFPLASVPSPGQYNRFRALPRGSNLAISPVDGAEFVPDQRFDISIELHSEDDSVPDLSKLEFLVNGEDASKVLNAPKPHLSTYEATYLKSAEARDSKPGGDQTKYKVARLNWRDLAIPKSGTYDISLKVGKEEVKAQWVVKGSSTRKAKNVVLFIGDGMASSMISAARYLSKNTRHGKFKNGDGFFSFEKFPAMGKIATNGMDSIITDSANSAATFNNGQKSYNNALNVYFDTTPDNNFDDTKVEILASLIRRKRPGMCIGVVTTAAVWDATPAAVYSYTRSRDDAGPIIDQNLNGFKNIKPAAGGVFVNNTDEAIAWSAPAVKADVILGGGGNGFCNAGTRCRSFNKIDQFKSYQDSGYTVVNDGDAMANYTGTDPLLGIFHLSHLNTWYDRNVETNNLVSTNSPLGDGKAPAKQPGLKEMTMKAIEVMDKKCSDGWFLMSEAASIDKQMHPIDFDRGLADLLELERTVQSVVDYDTKGDTQIYVTSDHAQGFDVYGTVDLSYMRKASNDDSALITGAANTNSTRPSNLKTEKRQAIGVYDDAGWPDSVMDANGLPTLFNKQTFKLAAGKIDSPNHVEDFEHKATPRSPTTTAQTYVFADGNTRQFAVPNPRDVTSSGGIVIAGNLPQGNAVTAHTLQGVDLYCRGPAASKCSGLHDNTELFFMMADALGLGDTPDEVEETKTCSAAATATATATATVTVTVTATYGVPTTTAGAKATGVYGEEEEKEVKTSAAAKSSAAEYAKATGTTAGKVTDRGNVLVSSASGVKSFLAGVVATVVGVLFM